MRAAGPEWSEPPSSRLPSRQGSRQGPRAAKGSYMGESADSVAGFEDERERVQWASTYRDVHAPLPHVYQNRARSRPKDSVVAGEFTSPHNMTYEEKVARGGESKILANQVTVCRGAAHTAPRRPPARASASASASLHRKASPPCLACRGPQG